MSGYWSAEPPNLLSAEIIMKVRSALEKGIVCGLHAFYCSGRGPEPCAFADPDSYIHEIERSRPGDWFTLWSVPMLADQNLLLIRKRGSPITEDELHKVRNWLNENPMHEFIAVGYPGNGASPETAWGDYESFNELQDLARRGSPVGEFAVLPLTTLREYTSKWIPRFHLVDAKRPNERGEVPLRGSY
jgi:hypothetical protein